MFFISSAFADTVTTTNTPGAHFNPLSLAPLAIILLLFWFLIMRPQQKKAKEHRNMLASLNVGDEVMTSSGIIGKIAQVQEQIVVLEVSEGVNLKFQKQAITSKLESVKEKQSK